MYCVFCGSERSDDALFCHKCGKRVFVESIDEVIGQDKADTAKEEHVVKSNKKIVEEKRVENNEDAGEEEQAESNGMKSALVGVLITFAIMAVAGLGFFVAMTRGVIDGIMTTNHYDESVEDEYDEYNKDDMDAQIDKDEVKAKKDKADTKAVDETDDELIAIKNDAKNNEKADDVMEEYDEQKDICSSIYQEEYQVIEEAPEEWLKENALVSFKAESLTINSYDIYGDGTPELIVYAESYKEYERGKSGYLYVISCSDDVGAYVAGEGEMGVTDELHIYKGTKGGKLATKFENGTGEMYIEEIRIEEGKFVLGKNLYTGKVDDAISEDIIPLSNM